jgi:nitrate reductase assembly molybdenum cofactor insertion protein NarJ
MNNWLCDEAPRVLRTIEKIVDKVKDAIQNARDVWQRLRVVLCRALEPFPEAQAAVVGAIDAELVAA